MAFSRVLLGAGRLLGSVLLVLFGALAFIWVIAALASLGAQVVSTRVGEFLVVILGVFLLMVALFCVFLARLNANQFEKISKLSKDDLKTTFVLSPFLVVFPDLYRDL